MKLSTTIAVGFVLALLGGERSAQADEIPIVYSRCPRGGKPFTASGKVVKGGIETTVDATFRGGELPEMLPDTSRPLGEFVAPCDLVYRDATGSEKILYSCIESATKDSACAALDAAVSFDAKTVAVAVFRGSLERYHGAANGQSFDAAAENTATFSVELPGSVLHSTEAQIVLVDIATGKQTELPHPKGVYDFAPAWMSNGRIAFSSAGRRPIYGPMPLCTNNSGFSIQLHAMDPDGRNVELISPHGLASELHPLQLVDGRVSLASWQTFGMLAYRHGNSFGGCGTLPNFFHVYGENPDGSGANALYGQHLADPTAVEYSSFSTHMAAHFFGQTSDARVWTAEYYRANNLGLGSIVGFPLPPHGEEGPNATEAAAAKMTPYRAWGEIRLAPWASPFDQAAAEMPMPPMKIAGYSDPLHYAGKLGHPSGLPGNRMMLTWGVGACTLNVGEPELTAMKHHAALTGDNPWCDVGIYRTEALTETSTIAHPSALVPIVNSPDFHEFMARPAVPYKDVYGVDKPAVIPRAESVADGSLEPATPFGVLGASSILHRETKSATPIAFEDLSAANQGTDTIDYSDDEVCGIRILAVHSNRKVESYWKSTSTVGERVEIIGEFPVRNYNDDGTPVVDGLGKPDTSFRVRFPADSPYLMQAIDCEGRTLNGDQTWQSLRPGETKTCNGCHVHSHAATKLPFASSWAAKSVGKTHLLGQGKVPLLAGGSGKSVVTKEVDGYGYMIEFDRDVMPILQSRCVSCHGPSRTEAGLRLDVARDWTKVQAGKDDSTYFRLALDVNQTFVPDALKHAGSHGNTLGKPNLSKYVRMMNSRGSLLYWKAKNARTDNRKDDTATDDVDFGGDHPTSITPEEVSVIGRWIDTGSGWGPDFVKDTVYPVLHLSGVSSGSTITSLRVGTTDVGDGIDPDSLTVCVVDKPGAACGSNLAGKAELAGVATIALSAPLADPDAEVVASVKDRAGNQTDGRYTVRFLLGSEPPPPPATDPDAGPDGSVDGPDRPANADGNGDVAGGCGCRTSASDLGSRGLFALAALACAAWMRRR